MGLGSSPGHGKPICVLGPKKCDSVFLYSCKLPVLPSERKHVKDVHLLNKIIFLAHKQFTNSETQNKTEIYIYSHSHNSIINAKVTVSITVKI